MSGRSIPLHFGLLILALAAAWFTFRAELADDTPADEASVVLLEAASGDAERLVYEGELRTVSLESRRDDVGRWFEGSATVAPPAAATEELPSPAEGGSDAEGGSVPDNPGDEAPPAIEIFRGGTAVEALWRLLEPFRARRVLGEVDGEKLVELGLDPAGATLVLTLRGRDHRFALGNEVYGSSDRYARDSEGRVVVLPAPLTRDLEIGVPRLMERRLIEATRPEVEALELSRNGSSVRIVQHDAGQLAGSYWSLAGQEAAAGEFETWADKFFRLEAVAYRSGEPQREWRAEATIVVESREYGTDTVELWSVEEAGKRIWLGRSAYTRLIAELAPLAGEVCEDLDSLLP